MTVQFVLVCSFNCKFKFLLPLLLEILGNMCITIVCFLGFHVINFEIILIFLIKPFSCVTDKSRKKKKVLKIFRLKIDFKTKEKVFLIVFKGILVSKNLLRPKSVLLVHHHCHHFFFLLIFINQRILL